MALFRSERGIGRGEIAESQLEVPIFVVGLVICSVLLFVQHLYFGNLSMTLAFSISLMVFGTTVIRVDYGVYILLIAMLLSPEIEAGNAYSGERTLSFRYDDILIIVIFMGVMVKLAFEGRLSLWQPSPINTGIIVYYSICIASTLLAWERNLGAWDRRTAFFIMLKMLEFYCVFFLCGHAVRNLRDVRYQVILFFIVSVIVAGYAASTVGVTPRVSAPFEKGGTEPNTLGGYLVLVMCISFALMTQAPFMWQKILFTATIGIAFYPFLFTLSRASYLAFLVGIVTISFISRRFVFILLVGVVLACSTLIMPDKVIERVSYTFQHETGQQVKVAGREVPLKVDKSTHERFLVWRKVGFLLFSIGGLYTWLGGGVSWESVLDSQYARVILETGLLGLAAFVFMQYRILRTSREAYRWTNDWFSRGIAMGVFGATLALVVHSIGTISFLIVRIMEPYWFLVAICVAVRNDAIARHWARLRAAAGASKATPSSGREETTVVTASSPS